MLSERCPHGKVLAGGNTTLPAAIIRYMLDLIVEGKCICGGFLIFVFLGLCIQTHPPDAHAPHVHVHSGPLVSCASDQASCLRSDH
jgi:hypothetical protein